MATHIGPAKDPSKAEAILYWVVIGSLTGLALGKAAKRPGGGALLGAVLLPMAAARFNPGYGGFDKE